MAFEPFSTRHSMFNKTAPIVTPFGSTSERKITHFHNEELPGPGEYFQESITPQKKQIRPKYTSWSVAERPVDQSTGPGPGEYHFEKPIVKSPKKRLNHKNVVFTKLKTTPSMPLSRYGYRKATDEEDATLVPYVPQNANNDVGPGSYNLTNSPHVPTVSLSRQSGRDSRIFLPDTEESPGPGQYSLEKKSTKGTKRSTSAFASRTTKSDLVSEELQTHPGPGEYEQRQSWEQKHTGKSVQSFGVTANRNLDNNAQMKESTPGPGAYNFINSSFTKKRYNYGRTIAFSTASSRFQKPKESTATPGPGEYEYNQNQTKPAKKNLSMALRSTHSSLERRTKKTDPDTLVGIYPEGTEPTVPKKRREQPLPAHRQLHTSVHSRKTKNETEERTSPGPGSYYHPEMWGNTPGGSITQTEQRKTVFSFTQTPGPGEYDIEQNPKPKEAKGESRPFMTTAKRFEEQKNTKGTETNTNISRTEQNTMVKKSFNAKIIDKPLLPYEEDTLPKQKQIVRPKRIGMFSQNLATAKKTDLETALDLGF